MGFFFEDDEDDMYDYIPSEYIYPQDDYYTPEEYMGEKWWYIDGVPGYMVSNCGRVWSEKSQQFIKVKPMDKHGHLGVCLSVDGIQLYFYIHRLMAKAFIPNPNNYPVVRHLDDDPHNNWIDNLAWGTQRDNAMDALKNGRTFTADPEIRDKALDSVRRPIMATDLNTREELHFRGQNEASRILGIQQANIWKVLNGERRQAGGYNFRYVKGRKHDRRYH